MAKWVCMFFIVWLACDFMLVYFWSLKDSPLLSASLANQHFFFYVILQTIWVIHDSCQSKSHPRSLTCAGMMVTDANGEWDVFWGDNGSFRWNNSNKRKFGNSLQKNSFMRRSLEEKKQIKELGLDQPDLKIQQQASDRGRCNTRGFSHLFYAKQVGWLDVMLSVFFIAFPACFFRMLALKFCGQ